MTTKQDFTSEEWELLMLAPVYASTYIMTADISIVGAFREFRAMGKILKDPSPPEGVRELVDAMMADAHAMLEKREKLTSSEAEQGQDPREPLRQGLQQAAALLDVKCSPVEAAGFKQWLVDIAQATAEADKEGSHFGIGGQRISDKEKAALAELESFLNR